MDEYLHLAQYNGSNNFSMPKCQSTYVSTRDSEVQQQQNLIHGHVHLCIFYVVFCVRNELTPA